VTCSVVALPPISGLKYRPSIKTASTAAFILVADSTYPNDESSKAADRIEAIGLAIPWPSRSGAEPWTLPISIITHMRWMETYGSPMTKLSPALIDGTSPREPTRAAAPSL
jgi:hypothetical protein